MIYYIVLFAISRFAVERGTVYTKKIIFININPKKIKFILLDSSYQDDSNEPKIIKIQSLDCLKTEICRIRNFKNTSKISKILRIFI
jgi:hypothetical protein